MSSVSKCPKCGSDYPYQDGTLWICPECSHEWSGSAGSTSEAKKETENKIIRDAFGNVLNDGDSVTVVKDLKVKGSSSVVKVGTKAKNIRLVSGDDGHDIACKIDGLGAINLKSEFVKKV